MPAPSIERTCGKKLGDTDEQIVCWGLEDWDFWLWVASHGGSFVHFPKIGFDYRVRRNSMIVETLGFDFRVRTDSMPVKTRQRVAEIVNYIFGKSEMACYKLLRETDEEVQNLRAQIGGIQGSPSYGLGRGLFTPARLWRKLWHSFH